MNQPMNMRVVQYRSKVSWQSLKTQRTRLLSVSSFESQTLGFEFRVTNFGFRVEFQSIYCFVSSRQNWEKDCTSLHFTERKVYCCTRVVPIIEQRAVVSERFFQVSLYLNSDRKLFDEDYSNSLWNMYLTINKTQLGVSKGFKSLFCVAKYFDHCVVFWRYANNRRSIK